LKKVNSKVELFVPADSKVFQFPLQGSKVNLLVIADSKLELFILVASKLG